MKIGICKKEGYLSHVARSCDMSQATHFVELDEVPTERSIVHLPKTAKCGKLDAETVDNGVNFEVVFSVINDNPCPITGHVIKSEGGKVYPMNWMVY